ncbi:hypothetical protein ACLOJK_028175 [Asimina triloba]
MANHLLDPPATSSPPPPYHKPHFSPFYYGLVAIATMVIILLAYNVVVVGWCWRNERARGRFDPPPHGDDRGGVDASIQMMIPISKYRKDGAEMQASDSRECECECSVCLSVFSEGESIRELPQCKHSFHADCIDMWLFSHSSCPLCRATVVASAPRPLLQVARGGGEFPAELV